MTTSNKKGTRSQRSISTGRPRSYSELYKNEPTATVSPTGLTTGKRSNDSHVLVVKTPEVVDWKHQYGYVLSDLRRLLIVAVALIAIIVVVGFII